MREMIKGTNLGSWFGDLGVLLLGFLCRMKLQYNSTSPWKVHGNSLPNLVVGAAAFVGRFLSLSAKIALPVSSHVRLQPFGRPSVGRLEYQSSPPIFPNILLIYLR